MCHFNLVVEELLHLDCKSIHDDMQHREAITNLVMVLGRDKLIEYAEERIEFRKQRE